VIEILLRQRFGEKYEFFSAGISPIAMPSMDHRSLKFLKDYNINHGLHTPKKINRSMLNYFDKFLAVDPFVLNHLNAKYPKYKQKFRSMTMQFSDIDIVDPYKLKPYEYIKVMQDIKYISEKINLELY
tara:strand:- start:2976 stop:3359 length:384 start_codon:yes stop_codon:yes gene_type:complete